MFEEVGGPMTDEEFDRIAAAASQYVHSPTPSSLFALNSAVLAQY